MKLAVRPGQRWRSKSGGFVVEITGKATGNIHWHAKRGRHSHTIHEGALAKFYKWKRIRVTTYLSSMLLSAGSPRTARS